MAQRRIRIEAASAPEPSVRTAILSAEEPRQPLGIVLWAWAGIALPVTLPLITLLLLAVNWSRYPARSHPDYMVVVLAFMATFGLMTAALQFALRYHARWSDWASDPAASLRYRTNLSLMMGTASMGVIGWAS